MTDGERIRILMEFQWQAEYRFELLARAVGRGRVRLKGKAL